MYIFFSASECRCADKRVNSPKTNCFLLDLWDGSLANNAFFIQK